MYFKKILVALDGSRNSQIAADYAFWLATHLNAKLAGQHIIDPRLVDLFIEPEFAEHLGIVYAETPADKVMAALRKIGNVVLELFATEAVVKGIKPTVFLDEGYVVERLLSYASEHDLLIVGHRGRTDKKAPTKVLLGSVAEQIAVAASIPVLISVQPPNQLKEILVAYDGSEASRGALLMGENLAKELDCSLKALTVVPSKDDTAKAKVLIEQGQSFLREPWEHEVFAIKYGGAAQSILSHAGARSLLVVGAYGYSDPEENVLGSTTAKVIRAAKTSVLIYKHPVHKGAPTPRKTLHEQNFASSGSP
jgi:nucleotide-binding universal stress UspA family protein